MKKIKYILGILLIVSVTFICHDAFEWKLINRVDVIQGLGQQNIVVRDGFAYWISQKAMHVLDVADPMSVDVVSVYSNDATLADIALYEDFAVVSSLDAGLLIINIHNPEKPKLVEMYPKTGDARFSDIVIKDNFAFVADYTGKSVDNQIIVLDLSNPMQIKEVARIANSGKPLTVYGDYLYAKGDHSGDLSSVDWLNIIDISNIKEPELILRSNSFGAVSDAEIQDHYLYIATSDGIVITDITNPADPVELSRIKVMARQLLIQNEFIYYLGFEKVGMLNITDADRPKQIATTREVRYATDIAYSMRHIYFVGGSQGLYIFEGGER